jgi:hypothetical protein
MKQKQIEDILEKMKKRREIWPLTTQKPTNRNLLASMNNTAPGLLTRKPMKHTPF